VIKLVEFIDAILKEGLNLEAVFNRSYP